MSSCLDLARESRDADAPANPPCLTALSLMAQTALRDLGTVANDTTGEAAALLGEVNDAMVTLTRGVAICCQGGAPAGAASLRSLAHIARNVHAEVLETLAMVGPAVYDRLDAISACTRKLQDGLAARATAG